MSHGLVKNSSLSLIANMALAVSNWLILVLIAKHYDAALLGAFVLALSFSSPAFLFASFKMRTLLVVDADWRYSLENYATARVMANSLVTLLLVLLAQTPLLTIPTWVLIVVIAYKWCDTLSEFCHSYMRRLDRFKHASSSLTARSVLTICLASFCAANAFSFDILLMLWLSAALIFVTYDLFSVYRLARAEEPSGLSLSAIASAGSVMSALSLYKEYLTVAVALVISSLFVHLPNLMLANMLDVTAAGTFATISYFLVAGALLINSLSQAATPLLTRQFSNRSFAQFRQTLQKLCIIGFAIGIAGAVLAYWLGEYFLSAFYNDSIAQHADVLLWVMFAAAVRYIYIFIGTAFAAIQAFHIQTKIYAAGLVVMFLSGIYLIEANGILGAAQAMLIATLVELLLYLLAAKPHFQKAFYPEVEAA